MSPLLIDSHEDLAYSALSFGRDYRRSAHLTRRLEQDTTVPLANGNTLLGWPDYQRAQAALVFGTLFLVPDDFVDGPYETQVYRNTAEARRLWQTQIDYYNRLADEAPEMFRRVNSRLDLASVLAPWDQSPAVWGDETAEEVDSDQRVTHPVGLVLLMEGLGGLREPAEMEDWWQAGVRIAGPVWAGSRFCGSNRTPGEFTREGYRLLEVMANCGFTLDVSHMSEKSCLQALDRYQGTVIATHANARAVLKSSQSERLLSDLQIRRLVERDGIIGVVPYGPFLRSGWSREDDPRLTTLDVLAAHIDHICQLAGDARHVGFGTDFDGGWGCQDAPMEIDTIADMQKLAPVLAERGYSSEDISAIFGITWRQFLERTLPER